MNFEHFNADIRLLLHTIERFHKNVDEVENIVNHIFLAELCGPLYELASKFLHEKWGLAENSIDFTLDDVDLETLDKIIHELWESRK